jgi:hypothetical protein
MMAGVNLTKIYCKHFYKCYNVPTIQQWYDTFFWKTYSLIVTNK